MELHYLVNGSVIHKDGECRYSPDIKAPDRWAIAYHWSPTTKGIVEGGGSQREFFDDEKRIKFILDAFDKANPDELKLPFARSSDGTTVLVRTD